MKKIIFLMVALATYNHSMYAHTYSVEIKNASPQYMIEVGGLTIPPSGTGKLQVHHGHKYTVLAKQPTPKKGQGPASPMLEEKHLDNQYFTHTGKNQVYVINPEPDEAGATMTITKQQQNHSSKYSSPNSYKYW